MSKYKRVRRVVVCICFSCAGLGKCGGRPCVACAGSGEEERVVVEWVTEGE